MINIFLFYHLKFCTNTALINIEYIGCFQQENIYHRCLQTSYLWWTIDILMAYTQLKDRNFVCMDFVNLYSTILKAFPISLREVNRPLKSPRREQCCCGKRCTYHVLQNCQTQGCTEILSICF